MFSLRDLRLVSVITRSRRATCAKDHGLYLNYPQINEVAKSDHMVIKIRKAHDPLRVGCRDHVNRARNADQAERFLVKSE